MDFPGGYRWSSYKANAEGRADPLLTPHGLYLALGRNAAERRLAYQKLFEVALGEKDLARVRFAIQHDFSLGR